MKAIRKTLLLVILGAGLSVALTIVALGMPGGLRTAHAQDPDGVITGIDMNPTGNTATTLGTIDRCRSVSPGDTIQIDVFVDGLNDQPNCEDLRAQPPGGGPFCDSLLASSYDLKGWPASGNDDFNPRIAAANERLFLCAAGCGIIIDPPTVPDGTPAQLSPGPPNTSDYFAAIVGASAAVYAVDGYHQGVLGRYWLDTTGAVPGLYGLTLQNVSYARDNPPGGGVTNKFILDANSPAQYGLLAVGVPCPDPPTSVGGIADLPDVARSPAAQSDSSDPPYAALAGGLAAVLALAAGAWYARRRLS